MKVKRRIEEDEYDEPQAFQEEDIFLKEEIFLKEDISQKEHVELDQENVELDEQNNHQNNVYKNTHQETNKVPPNIISTTIIPSDGFPLDQCPFLSESTLKSLAKNSIKSLFDIQFALFNQFIIHDNAVLKEHLSRDWIVTSPTGTGKTLAYVLPVVQKLSSRIVTRIRALVILPTRDLALQVGQVFKSFVHATSLKVGIAVGSNPFQQEKEQLIDANGNSRVDILVSTPGRLIDHIEMTNNFTLQHVQFLVIDEVDRLLNQSYHGWLSLLLDRVNEPWKYSSTKITSFARDDDPFPGDSNYIYTPPMKWLFSATMTLNPEKLFSLNLIRPQLFQVTATNSRYETPASLTENYLVVKSQDKISALLMILERNPCRCICFTNSNESTEKLNVFLSKWNKVKCKCITNNTNGKDRKKFLERFMDGQFQLLVCSDGLARGMDISGVDMVVSYDAPLFLTNYVHRVGRTARAGRNGVAYTLVHEQEAHFFKEMISKKATRINKWRYKEEDLKPYRDIYSSIIEKINE